MLSSILQSLNILNVIETMLLVVHDPMLLNLNWFKNSYLHNISCFPLKLDYLIIVYRSTCTMHSSIDFNNCKLSLGAELTLSPLPTVVVS